MNHKRNLQVVFLILLTIGVVMSCLGQEPIESVVRMRVTGTNGNVGYENAWGPESADPFTAKVAHTFGVYSNLSVDRMFVAMNGAVSNNKKQIDELNERVRKLSADNDALTKRIDDLEAKLSKSDQPK
jgi:hypothetical protein